MIWSLVKAKAALTRREMTQWRIGCNEPSGTQTKGVICAVWKNEWMPVDADGNRAEVITDDLSVIKRMNIGRLYEQWTNACSRDVSKRVRKHLDEEGSVQEAWEYLLSYYRIVSPWMAELLVSSDYEGTPEEHVKEVYQDGVYLWSPTNNPADSLDRVRLLREHFHPTYTPVTYGGGYITEKPVLIGSIYMILLEKTGVDWSGASSSKLQHFGIPAKTTNHDKYEMPGRNSPVRILGETEVRLLSAFVGSDVVVDYLDQSNNPATHKAVVQSILTAEQPTNIASIVDRKTLPLGQGRNLQYIKHIMECAGVRFKRSISDPLRQADIEEQQKTQR